LKLNDADDARQSYPLYLQLSHVVAIPLILPKKKLRLNHSAHHNSEACLETHNELRNACQIIEGVCVPLNFMKFKKEKDNLLSDGEGNQYYFNRN
jgi:hypothetical protein